MSSSINPETQMNVTNETTAAATTDAWDEPYEASKDTSAEVKADSWNEQYSKNSTAQTGAHPEPTSRSEPVTNDRFPSRPQLPPRPDSRQEIRHASDVPRHPPSHNARHQNAFAHTDSGGNQVTLLSRLGNRSDASSWGPLAARAERFAPTNNHAIRTSVDYLSRHSREAPIAFHSLNDEAPSGAPKIDPVQRPGKTRDAGWHTKPRVEHTQPPESQPAAPKTTSIEVSLSGNALKQGRTRAETQSTHVDSLSHPRDTNGESDILRHIVFLSAPPKHSKSQDGDPADETTTRSWSETQLSSYWTLLDTMKSYLGKPDTQAKQDTALHAIVKHFPLAQQHGDYKGKKPTSAVLDAIYDLCEEASSEVRKMGYRALGALSKHVDGRPFERNVDILCQILANRCSSHEMDCLSGAVLDHLEASPVQTLKVMLAFLANNFVELDRAADRVRSNILRILAVDAHDFFTCHYSRELPSTSTKEVTDVETEAEFLEWLRQTVLKCQTSTNLRDVFTLVSHFTQTLWMPDVDRASCPKARLILALRQRWADTLAIKLVAHQRNTSLETLNATTELTGNVRRDGSPSEALPMALMLLGCRQMEEALIDSAPIAQDATSPPQQTESHLRSVGVWRLPRPQGEHHAYLPSASAACLLETLSKPAQILAAGSMIAVAQTANSSDTLQQVARDVAAAIPCLVARSSPKEQVENGLCPLEHLVIGESLLFSLLQLLVSEARSNEKLAVWYIASQHDCRSRLRVFQKTVDQVADALGFREKDSRSLAKSTDGDEKLEILLDVVFNVTRNLGLCLGELSGMPLTLGSDPSWLAKATGTVKDIADRLHWEQWLLSMEDHQAWADVKALCSRVPLKRELKALPQASLNHNSSAKGPTDREFGSRKSPFEPESKALRPADDAATAERGTKRRASEDVGTSSAWRKVARHADTGDRRGTCARRPETDLDNETTTSRGSPFSLGDASKVARRDVSPDPREGHMRRETHTSISIRGKGRSIGKEEAGGDVSGERWMPMPNHEGSASASGHRRRDAYDGMGRFDGRGPHPSAPHDRHDRHRMGGGASSGHRSARHPSYQAQDRRWW